VTGFYCFHKDNGLFSRKISKAEDKGVNHGGTYILADEKATL
jgi:hypothetical protein